jgi:hypothetical protein
VSDVGYTLNQFRVSFGARRDCLADAKIGGVHRRDQDVVVIALD